MMHRTLIGGTAYEIVGGKTKISGTTYPIYKGRTLVDGAGYDILFGKRLRDYDVGEIVYTYVNGVPIEFIVVHQGNPDTTVYDASCDGTWLLMRNLYNYRLDDDYGENNYENSPLHNYLNGDFYSKFNSKVQKAIKTVKIPHVVEEGTAYGVTTSVKHVLKTGNNGLETKLFLLSAPELNWTGNGTGGSVFFNDGVCLKYFEGFQMYDSRRVAHLLDASADGWTTRSMVDGFSRIETMFWTVNAAGSPEGLKTTFGKDDKYYLRAAMICRGDTLTARRMINQTLVDVILG